MTTTTGEASLTCPHCHAPTGAGDTWCRSCYAVLSVPMRTVGPAAVGPMPTFTPPPPAPEPVAAPEPEPTYSRFPEARVAMPSPYAVVRPVNAQEKGTGVGIALVILCIAIGGLQTLFFKEYVGDTPGIVEHKLRVALVATIGFYALVLLLLLLSLKVTGRKLRWRGAMDPLSAIGLGAVVGLAISGAELLIEHSRGETLGDPNVRALVGEGGFLRPALVVAVFVIAGPLIEEALFRGSLAEGLRLNGMSRWAVVRISAVAFAAWHWQPSHLGYFALGGVIFATLWIRGGLYSSAAAHICFNGLLTFAAISSNLGSHTFTLEGATVRANSDWSRVAKANTFTSDLLLEGPSGAAFVLQARPNDNGTTVATVASHVTTVINDLPPTFQNDGGSTIELPAGEAFEISGTDSGNQVAVVIIPTTTTIYIVTETDSGSGRAHRELPEMLQSLHVGY